MKTFEEFRDCIIADLPGILPENFAGAEILALPMKKNSKEVTGIYIRKPMGYGMSGGPVFYADTLYDDYQKGKEYDAVIDDMAHALKTSVTPEVDGVLDKIKDPDGWRVAAVPVNSVKVERFSGAEIVGDIAAVPYAVIDSDERGMSTVSITDDLLAVIDKSASEILETAKANMSQVATARTMLEVIADMMPPGMAEAMIPNGSPTMVLFYGYVVSASTEKQGAGVVFDKSFMDSVCEEYADLKNGAIVLPSSTDECILLPLNYGDPGRLADMVTNINAGFVKESMRLSDSVFVYYPGVGLAPMDPTLSAGR